MKLEYHQLDRETFAAMSRAAKRRLRIVAVASLVALAAPTVFATIFPGVVRSVLPNPAYWWPRLLPVYAIVVAIPGVFAMYRIVNDPRLRCPGCRKPLMPMRSLLMASGKCGRCGTQVMKPAPTEAGEPAETPAPTTDKPLLDPEAFRTTAARIQNRMNLIPVLIIIVGMSVPIAAITSLGESIRAATRPNPAAPIWITSAFLSYVAAIIGVAAWVGVRITKDPRVCCPRCHKPMIRHQAVVIATGRCGHCGAKALADDEHAGEDAVPCNRGAAW